MKLYNKKIFLLVIFSLVFSEETNTQAEPAGDNSNPKSEETNTQAEPAGDNSNPKSDSIKGQIQSIKNLLYNPCEGLNQEDCGTTEGCTYDVDNNACSQEESGIINLQNTNTQAEGQEAIVFKDEFLISVNIGTALGAGTNIRRNFGPGINFRANVVTPYGMTMGENQIKIAGNFAMMTMGATSGASYTDYSLTTFGASGTIDMGSMLASVGLGIASASGTVVYDFSESPDYAWTKPYLSAGIDYTLPLTSIFEKLSEQAKIKDLANASLSCYFNALLVTGAPSAGLSQSSELINLGISFNYPFIMSKI